MPLTASQEDSRLSFHCSDTCSTCDRVVKVASSSGSCLILGILANISVKQTDHMSMNTGADTVKTRGPAAVNILAVGMASLLAAFGVLALQYLALTNGHEGNRADIMSVVWVVFVSGVLVHSLFKKS